MTRSLRAFVVLDRQQRRWLWAHVDNGEKLTTEALELLGLPKSKKKLKPALGRT